MLGIYHQELSRQGEGRQLSAAFLLNVPKLSHQEHFDISSLYWDRKVCDLKDMFSISMTVLKIPLALQDIKY